MRLSVRFALKMSLALTGVMLVAGFLLYKAATALMEENQETAFIETVHNLNLPTESLAFERLGTEAKELDAGRVRRSQVRYGLLLDKTGYVYEETKAKAKPVALIVPPAVVEEAGRGLLGLIVAITLGVIVVGALVAFTVGNQVALPLEEIVEDIRHIARGDLGHRTRVRAGGEIAQLAKSIDRMAGGLAEAQEARLALSVREHELEVAREVRESLLPQSTPRVPGYGLGALQVGSPTTGGDFHDYIELDDGRVGLLVCDVSGRGIPGALVGATARSYLRVELQRGGDLGDSLRRVNRELARDVRRGMYVTAMYALLDPSEGTASVACAGHKVPLVRYSAGEKKLRLVHPEGIALGFDKGPVFDSTLVVQKIEIAPGDRILLANTGPLRVKDPSGEELGEKSFYRFVLQHAAEPTERMLQSLEKALEAFAAETPFPSDIAIVTVSRRA